MCNAQLVARYRVLTVSITIWGILLVKQNLKEKPRETRYDQIPGDACQIDVTIVS